MKREYHILSSLIFLIVCAYIVEAITVTMCMIAFVWAIVSDWDNLDMVKQFIGHRNIITHSIIIPVIIMIFNPVSELMMIVPIMGLHCLMDLKIRKKQRVGYANITLTSAIRLGGKASTIWLLSNFLLSFTIFVIWCLL